MSLLWIQAVSHTASHYRLGPGSCPHCSDPNAGVPDSHGLDIHVDEDHDAGHNCGCPGSFSHGRISARDHNGEAAGHIDYGYHPDGSAFTIDKMDVPFEKRGRGTNSTLMNHLWHAHPHALVHYTGFTPEGQDWHDRYREPDPGRVVHDPDDPRWHHHFGEGADSEDDDDWGADRCTRCNSSDPAPHADTNHQCLLDPKRR